MQYISFNDLSLSRESLHTPKVYVIDQNLEFQDWGLIEYRQALSRMENLVHDVIDQKYDPGVLVFCTHPPVVTLGRGTLEGDVYDWQGPVLEISRGGRATYHGPSQLVVYPILNLKKPRKDRGPQEIAGYLRALEESIVETLKIYDIDGVGKSLQKKSVQASAADETGVWVESRKIASLGIGVKRWVAYHGAAINLHRDAEAFQGMLPCGFQKNVMVSLEELKNEKINQSQFAESLKTILLRRL